MIENNRDCFRRAASRPRGLLPQCKPLKKALPHFNAERRVGARTTQVLLGHGWFGDYYKRFNLNDDHACACGAELQTREHLLCDCPILEPYRGPWWKAWKRTTSGPLFEGIDVARIGVGFILDVDHRDMLVDFLRETNAFFKGAVK
jgi:hypothetical protein